MLVDILEGFTELIVHGITHREIKPSNILFIDETYKLGGIFVCNQSQIVVCKNVQKAFKSHPQPKISFPFICHPNNF